MKLTVKNFGPIREAKNIAIKPMTVFVGPSNTGKSYLAILIYSIVKTFVDPDRHWILMHEETNELKIFDMFEKDSVDTSVEEIEKYFLAWAKAMSVLWKNEFVYCFGEEGVNILKDGEKNEKLSIKISDAENQIVLDLLSPDNSKLTVREKIKLYKSITVDLSKVLQRYRNGISSDKKDNMHQGYMLRVYLRTCINGFMASLSAGNNGRNIRAVSHYLPAVRGGIMQSHRTLVSALIGLAPRAGLSEASPVPLFSGVLSDFMQKLIDIDDKNIHRRFDQRFLPRRSRTRREIIGIGDDMEQKILHGKIEVKRSRADYPDFRYVFGSGKKEHDLPLMSASSMVSELAPVSLFVRHYVGEGDLLIIEEPEAHLHPAAQLVITDILVQLANAGVNVLITTHSDNVLEKISNNVLTSIVEKKIKSQFLEERKVSAYLFNRPKTNPHKKTKVNKIKFDDENGYLTNDHLNVSTALHNDSVRLLNKRQNNGN